MKKEIIVIDGPAASGKSTIAKIIAHQMQYMYIDSGAMYRCIALYKIEHDLNIEQLIKQINEIKICFTLDDKVYLNNIDVTNKIRNKEVTSIVSEIAKESEIRAYLVKQQQAYGLNKGIVMDGRDIGSVVFPTAKIKFYMEASVEKRAKRRYQEIISNGDQADYLNICEDIKKRDYEDMHRLNSPLIKVKDAIEIDTSNLSIDETVNKLMSIIMEKVK
ncbi:MAG: (d)CMP kinase [Bacilli bacterium]|jgi:cytidylate kinase|nr:(d)CMP kinase [Bacilli bacterium]